MSLQANVDNAARLSANRAGANADDIIHHTSTPIYAGAGCLFRMQSWLQDDEYRISLANNWWIFLTAGIIALLIALVTFSYSR